MHAMRALHQLRHLAQSEPVMIIQVKGMMLGRDHQPAMTARMEGSMLLGREHQPAMTAQNHLRSSSAGKSQGAQAQVHCQVLGVRAQETVSGSRRQQDMACVKGPVGMLIAVVSGMQGVASMAVMPATTVSADQKRGERVQHVAMMCAIVTMLTAALTGTGSTAGQSGTGMLTMIFRVEGAVIWTAHRLIRGADMVMMMTAHVLAAGTGTGTEVGIQTAAGATMMPLVPVKIMATGVIAGASVLCSRTGARTLLAVSVLLMTAVKVAGTTGGSPCAAAPHHQPPAAAAAARPAVAVAVIAAAAVAAAHPRAVGHRVRYQGGHLTAGRFEVFKGLLSLCLMQGPPMYTYCFS
mmetsp:Transcript_18029/g.38766  ORF Transcript_18029/g.38766 Transcript_18029/m.38766 type:complete len:351 (-) Transcript_18029:92-1144(-)